MAQSVGGVLVLRTQSRGLLLAVSGLSLSTVLLWAVSRTSGLPIGPGAWEAEPVGLADLAATSLGVASLGLALALLAGRRVARRPALPGRALGLAGVVAVTTLGVAGSTLPVVGGFAPADPAAPAHAVTDH